MDDVLKAQIANFDNYAHVLMSRDYMLHAAH